jgi:hypothetical protein
MKSGDSMLSWRRAWRLAALAGLCAATVTCTDANEALIVLQAQVPDDECLVSDNAAEGARLADGVLDVALDEPYGYELFPLVQSNLQEIAGAGEIEPNRVSITGAQVEVVPPPGLDVAFGDGCAAEFDTLTSASLQPGQSRAVKVEALRSCHARAFRGLFQSGRLSSSVAEIIQVRAIVRIKGNHGGTEILSNPFQFPIRICYGCLQTGFADQYAAFNFPNVPACDRLARNPYQGNPCPGRKAQDVGPILCCALDAKAERLQCPAAPSSSTTGTPPTP